MLQRDPNLLRFSLFFRFGSRPILVGKKYQVSCGGDRWLIEAIFDIPKARRQFHTKYYDTSNDEI